MNLEPFLFLARSALDRLCRRLEAQGLGCARIDLSLRLEPHGYHERSLTLPGPTCDVKTLLTLIRLELEGSPPGAPVIGFTFIAHPDRPRAAQLSIFGPVALSPDKLATTLARLFALLGAGRVGSPRTVDGHRPERFAMTDFRPPPPPKIRPEVPRARGLLAVRVLRPPVELEVRTRTENGKERRPVFLEPRDDERLAKQISGRVRVASGPWEMEEGWWSESPVHREYWDLEMQRGALLRIYRDPKTDRWLLDGVYD